MNYLKEYNLDDEQIKDVEKRLDKENLIDLFIYDKDKIIKILDIFRSIGINNFYGIIITNPYLFCDTIDSISVRIKEFNDNKALAELINKDALNMYFANFM